MPVGYLLDTNVISEIVRQRADPGVVEFFAANRPARKYISVLTLGELRKGVVARRARDRQEADRLSAWIDGIELSYSDHVLPINSAIARRWGELSATRPLPVIDTLLAATALIHDLTLVNRNVRDVASTGAPVLNPWRVSLSD